MDLTFSFFLFFSLRFRSDFGSGSHPDIPSTFNHTPDLQTLRLTPKEKEYLNLHCPYLQPDYVDWLAQLQLDPERQVEVVWRSTEGEGGSEGEEEVKNPEGWSEGDVRDEGEGQEVLGEVEIRVRGKWVEVILYEVILMALCECFKGWVEYSFLEESGSAFGLEF